MISQRPTLAEIDVQIDVLDRAEPTQNPIHWRRAFEFLKNALGRARRVRRFVTPPAVVIAVLLVWALHGDTWDLGDIKLALGAFFVPLAVGHIAMAALFAALRRESRIAALLRYYGDLDAENEMAIIE
jgi:hypothetical protein